MPKKAQLIELVKELCQEPIEWLVEYGHDGADVYRCKFCGESTLAHHGDAVSHDENCAYIKARRMIGGI